LVSQLIFSESNKISCFITVKILNSIENIERNKKSKSEQIIIPLHHLYTVYYGRKMWAILNSTDLQGVDFRVGFITCKFHRYFFFLPEKKYKFHRYLFLTWKHINSFENIKYTSLYKTSIRYSIIHLHYELNNLRNSQSKSRQKYLNTIISTFKENNITISGVARIFKWGGANYFFG
jgi:hypothetical protein